MALKKIGKILQSEKRKRKNHLTKQMQAKLQKWAFEAYKLDPTKPTIYYYNLFLNRLRESYRTSDQKELFFKNGIIEV